MAKSLLPSLREKKRYIAFEITGAKKNPSSVARVIEKSLRSLVGDQGMGRTGYYFVNDTFTGNKGTFKVSNTAVDSSRAALSLITEVDNEQVIVRSLGVSGILKKAKKYIAG